MKFWAYGTFLCRSAYGGAEFRFSLDSKKRKRKKERRKDPWFSFPYSLPFLLSIHLSFPVDAKKVKTEGNEKKTSETFNEWVSWSWNSECLLACVHTASTYVLCVFNDKQHTYNNILYNVFYWNPTKAVRLFHFFKTLQMGSAGFVLSDTLVQVIEKTFSYFKKRNCVFCGSHHAKDSPQTWWTPPRPTK